MVLLYLLIITALLLIVLLFTVASKIIVHFDTASSDVNVTLLWLYPVLKSVVSSENGRFVLSVYFLNKRILKRQLKTANRKLQNMNLIKKIKLTDIKINAEYGFKDPYFTGLLFGTINMISIFFTLESLIQSPDFLVCDDYVHVDASAKLNVGRSLLKLV